MQRRKRLNAQADYDRFVIIGLGPKMRLLEKTWLNRFNRLFRKSPTNSSGVCKSIVQNVALDKCFKYSLMVHSLFVIINNYWCHWNVMEIIQFEFASFLSFIGPRIGSNAVDFFDLFVDTSQSYILITQDLF